MLKQCEAGCTNRWPDSWKYPMRRDLGPCTMPTDWDLLSPTTGNPLSRISPGELKRTHLGWRKKGKKVLSRIAQKPIGKICHLQKYGFKMSLIYCYICLVWWVYFSSLFPVLQKKLVILRSCSGKIVDWKQLKNLQTLEIQIMDD